MFYKL